MCALLHSLLHDLSARCRGLEAEVTGLGTMPDEVEGYRAWVAHILEETNGRIADLLADPDLQLPALERNYLHDYNRLAELTTTFESGPVLVLARYSDNDRLMTLVCQTIAKEIAYPYDPVVCAALATHHYSTNPSVRLLLVPLLEGDHILGWPDLYHEIGHNILWGAYRAKPDVRTKLNDMVDACFEEQKLNATQNGLSESYAKDLEWAQRMWKRHWLLEFIADMIAAHLAGPAYGWTNVRLCVNLGQDVFSCDPEEPRIHPADHARAQAIEAVLRMEGLASEASEIRSWWDHAVRIAGHQEPQDFALYYPPALIDDVAGFVSARCTDIGLLSYVNRSDKGGDPCLTALVNEAWTEFRRDPEGFPAWQDQQIGRIRATLGLTAT